MTREYKIIEVTPDPKKPLATRAVVQVTDTETGEVLKLTDVAIGTGLDATAVKQALGRIEAEMSKRAAGIAELKAIVDAGGDITPTAPKAPEDNSAHILFSRRLRKLTALKQIQPIVDAQLASAMATLQGQVEAYIKANPDAI